MSGIFGFTYCNADDNILSDAIGGLEYWNRIYGRETYGQQIMESSGIGCHVEHFSDAFPYGGPVLTMKNYTAVIDALLYNRDELLPLLRLKDDSAISDEELLLRLIEEKGLESLSLVNGDFAGAVYDSAAHEWLLFRDHFGVRPLFYYLDDDLFAFSTDIRGLAALPQADTCVNEMQLYINMIGANPLSLTETDFANIHCVLPASVTRFRIAGHGFERSDHCYWRLRDKRIHMDSDRSYQAELRRLVMDAVHRRCDAITGLLGCELSGGLDSSVIDIIISRYGRDAVSYSWSWDPELLPIVDEADERNIIFDICDQEQIHCHFKRKEDMFTLSDKGEHLIPPYIDTINLSYSSAWIKAQGANVVFSGHGGDEGVSHRSRRYELWHNKEYIAYFNMYRNDFQGKPFQTLRAIRAGLIDAKYDKEYLMREMRLEAEFPQVIQSDFSKRMSAIYKPKPFTFNYDPVQFVMQGGTRPRLDNTAYQGAVNGVRYLYPYVDYRVMDFALSIPRSEYLTSSQNRAVFRNAFRDIMPDSLFEVRQKRTVSLASAPDDPQKNARHQARVTKLMEKLDRNVWEPYWNLDALEKLLREHDGSSGGIRSVDMLMSFLLRCLNVQIIQAEAKKWREFDEQDKTV